MCAGLGALNRTYFRLPRVFCIAFPDGLPGISLLLMRLVIAYALIASAAECVPAFSAGAAIGIIAGVLLAAGFLTPVGGALAAGQVLIILLKLIPACRGPMFDSAASAVFAMTILLAIAGSGPGAYSVDARVFGRRHVIIPRRNPSTRDDDH